MTLSELGQVVIIWGGIFWPIIVTSGLLACFKKQTGNSTRFWILSVSIGYVVMFAIPGLFSGMGPMTVCLLLFTLPIIVSVVILRLNWVKVRTSS